MVDMPLIPATREAEVGESQSRAGLRQKHETLFEQ
jgi:hypothetical protein